jgi:enterochelin esterase-like enzyme
LAALEICSVAENENKIMTLHRNRRDRIEDQARVSCNKKDMQTHAEEWRRALPACEAAELAPAGGKTRTAKQIPAVAAKMSPRQTNPKSTREHRNGQPEKKILRKATLKQEVQLVKKQIGKGQKKNK